MTVTKQTLKIGVAGMALVIGLALAVAAHGGTAPTMGKQLLNDLIAKVQQEGELNITAVPTMAGVARQMEQAFLNRFGLKIRINLNPAADETPSWSKMLAAVKAGSVPEYDAYLSDDVKVAAGKKDNLLKAIDNWELLLAEVNPLVGSGKVKPEQIAWGALKGYAIAWHNRVHGIMYNTKLISKTDVPQGHVDITNPKYKERYVVAPFVTMWLYGPLLYPKDKWLKVVEEIGKNAAAVLTFAAGSQRVNLGEFAFQPLNLSSYWVTKSKDPQAPVAVHWPTDFVQNQNVTYTVSAKARHPAGAALWVLWMTTPEAQQLWQSEIHAPNIMYGESALDLEVRSALSELKKKGAKVVSWFDSPETEAMMEWYGTREGTDYRKRLENALRQRK